MYSGEFGLYISATGGSDSAASAMVFSDMDDEWQKYTYVHFCCK